jgi:hypothetical protein
MPLGLLSTARPETVVEHVLATVDECWKTLLREDLAEPEVFLVGHSLGAVLARSVYCRAWGARDDATIDLSRARPWAARIRRIILFAGLNRGWTTTSALGPVQRFVMRLGAAVGHALSLLGREPVVFAARRGAPFLTTMRLQWLELARHPPNGVAPPLTVQLLGTRDDLVSPADNVDLATGGDFLYLEIPGSGHADAVELGEHTKEWRTLPYRLLHAIVIGPPAPAEVQETRRKVFRLALEAPLDELQAAAVRPADVDDLLQLTTDDFDVEPKAKAFPEVRHVVFVIHGIRDRGYWTKKLARAIKEEARRNNTRLRSVTSSYGYFALLPFVLPWMRREKVEWLLDQYVAAKALYPDPETEFSYVGHSNGTYLVARALELCPALTLSRVVFAGSVVRTRYPWARMIDQARGSGPAAIGHSHRRIAEDAPHDARGQVGQVVNYVATADWVVAVFPRCLEMLRLQDLGSAGHDGFGESPGLRNVFCIRGSHGAALHEEHWKEIAAFVVRGVVPPADADKSARSRLVRLAGAASPAIWLALLALALLPAYALMASLGLWSPARLAPLQNSWLTATVPAWARALALAAYLALVKTVLTRF